MLRRILLTALAVVAACLLAAQAGAGSDQTRTQVCVRNFSSATSDAEIKNALPAFQAAVDQYFAPAWGNDAVLTWIGNGPIPSGCWLITLTDKLNCSYCLGYHDTWQGLPRSWLAGGDGWPKTFSHELFEMLADPWVSGTNAGRGGLFVHVGNRFYLVEVADPVEEDSFPLPGADGTPIPISDFVLPAYYRLGVHGPYDFLGLLKGALTISPEGGYTSWLENGVWQHGRSVR